MGSRAPGCVGCLSASTSSRRPSGTYVGGGILRNERRGTLQSSNCIKLRQLSVDCCELEMCRSLLSVS
eukprot:scaffold54879_cov68-Phaeocystis_antarctica.AAC.1